MQYLIGTSHISIRGEKQTTTTKTNKFVDMENRLVTARMGNEMDEERKKNNNKKSKKDTDQW